MTQKIHLLSPQQAQQIAAGEVVERPANIVKELLENSLDAGATAITIAIEKAGKQLISITDNGCGMNPQDAELCFSRHATSKLHSVDDLMNLSTFGFRGEALASIAAVSHLTLTTKERDGSRVEPGMTSSGPEMPQSSPSRGYGEQSSTDKLGTRVVFEHGAHAKTEQVACTPGTTIEIRDLFATVPVRKSFLKQDETEWNQIMAAITGLALTHIDRTIKVTKDSATVLNAPRVTNLKDRITQLWGHNMAQQLTPIAGALSGPVTVTGFASTPPYARYGRQQLIFFVNNRLVKNGDIAKAVLKGYKHALPPGKYPAVCMMIEIDQEQVDVNIHPRKEEVRFTKPGVVARSVQEAITRTLEAAIEGRLAPTAALPFTPNAPTNNELPSDWIPAFAGKTNSAAATSPSPHQPAPTSPRLGAEDSAGAKAAPPGPDPGPTSVQPAHTQAKVLPNTKQIKICGQLFTTYILIEQDNELVMVDQHAAHERILYHQFTSNFENKQGTQLLFPETITLTAAAVADVLAHQKFFASQGIALHQAGPTQIAVTSSPPKLQNESLSELVRDAADFIATHKKLDTEQFSRQLNEHVHSHMACKAAVKAGDTLDEEMMKTLVEQLMRTPNKFMCVHGRPTMWAVSKAEIEKRFRRR